MNEPIRPRRLRRTPALRAMTRETRLSAESLIYPVFVVEGEEGLKREIETLPGQYHWSVDRVCEAAEECLAAGVDKLIVFGLPDHKDELGSGAYDEDGVVQQAMRTLRERYPELLIVGDVCLCEYTSHGHCGVLHGESPDNDETLPLLAKTAVSQARAGADVVAPSAMMDDQIAAIRSALDEAGFSDTAIMSYSAKYASAFYGPFRGAADSTPQRGAHDRKQYQMDPHNVREAVKESLIDEAQGADILMVKPALPYLDVISEVKAATDLPLAAYQVSGEYAMIKAAAAADLVDEERIVGESAVSIFRAGADILITYYAKEIAAQVNDGRIG